MEVFQSMKVCVIGLGYIGFPTACLMAGAGHEVIGVDVNESVVEQLHNGRLHIKDEDGLGELAQSVLANGALTVSTSPVEADVFLVCVPTPLRSVGQFRGAYAADDRDSETGVPLALDEVAVGREQSVGCNSTSMNGVSHSAVDLTHLKSAVRSIAPFVRPDNLIIVESTVPPGTTEHVVLPILEEYGWTRDDIRLAHAPERVIPGAIMREMIENDRVVGGLTSAATVAAVELYESLVKGNVFTTDATTAEFVKLIENTYRDVNIALANELARVAEHLGIDAQESISMANRHPRVNILQPGPGVGGHCIPVDPHFIIGRAPQLTPLMQAARAVNEGMVDDVVKIVDKVAKKESLRRWVILGAAYKADVADERNSPSLKISRQLMESGLTVSIHDPYIERFNEPLDSVIQGADGLLVVTDHTVYRELDPEIVAQHVARRFVVDTRLCIDAGKWEDHGFVVRRLGDGRPSRVRSTT